MLVFLVAEMTLYEALSSYKRKHRDKIKDKEEEIKHRDEQERQKVSVINVVISQAKLLIISFIPIFNIISLFTYLFKGIEIKENVEGAVDKTLDEI